MPRSIITPSARVREEVMNGGQSAIGSRSAEAGGDLLQVEAGECLTGTRGKRSKNNLAQEWIEANHELYDFAGHLL